MNNKEMLEGVIDFQIHPGPDAFPRVADAYEMAFLANRMKMKGIVLRHHDVDTTQMAELIQKDFPELNVVGGICLEGAVGGINPRAVEISIKSGAKIIWLPSIDALYNHELYAEYKEKKQECGQLLEGLIKRSSKWGLFSVLNDEGKITGETREIIQLAKENDIALATGHMGPKERKVFIEEAYKMGLRKIIVTHANSSWTFCSVEEQKNLVREGVFFEYCFLPLVPYVDNQDPALIAEMIKAVGEEHVVLGTDLGASWAGKGVALPHPTEGMAAFIASLLLNNISKEVIAKIACTNACELLNI